MEDGPLEQKLHQEKQIKQPNWKEGPLPHILKTKQIKQAGRRSSSSKVKHPNQKKVFKSSSFVRNKNYNSKTKLAT